jgi:hypothetical protein
MTNAQPKTVTINGKEFTEDQLSDQQKAMVNHILDLDQKINATAFQLDQLQFSREAFVNALAASTEQSQ